MAGEVIKRERRPRARPWLEVSAALQENRTSIDIFIANPERDALLAAFLARGNDLVSELQRSLRGKAEDEE